MHELFDAVDTFFSELAHVKWQAVGIALGLQLLRLFCRAVAWRAIVAAAFPDLRVPLDRVTGAYFAGTGINAVAPARSGDVVKLVLVKAELPGTTYTTLAPTLIVETLFDAVVASVVLVVGAVRRRPACARRAAEPADARLELADRPPTACGRDLRRLGDGDHAARRHLVAPGARFQGTDPARLRDPLHPGRYLSRVVSWQALSWAFRIASIWFFLDAFDIPSSPRNVMLVLAVQSLSTLLPFTPGGLGTQQGFLLYAFRDSSIPHTELVAFSVGMQLATNAFNFAIGLIALLLIARTVRWKQIIAPERAEIDRARTER